MDAQNRPEPPPSRAPTASACEPYRELIELALGRGRNAMASWQDLVDQHGGDGPMVRHPVTGKSRRARLFVLTLGGAAASAPVGALSL